MSAAIAALLLLQSEPVEIRLVENVGVVITSGEHRIAFDSIADPDAPGDYVRADAQIRTDVISGEGEFEGLESLFLTAFNPSTADPIGIRSFLESNIEARLVATDWDLSLLYSSESWADIRITNSRDLRDDPFISRYTVVGMPAHDLVSCAFDLDQYSFAGRLCSGPTVVWNEFHEVSYLLTLNHWNLANLGAGPPQAGWLRLWSLVRELENVDAVIFGYAWTEDAEAFAQLQSHFPNARLIVTGIPAYMHPSDLEARFGPDGFLQQPGDTIVLEGGE